jgi:hypothetical protein
MASRDNTRLVIGSWELVGQYGTLPAVLDLDGDDYPVLVSSRHIAVLAVRRGLVDLDFRTKRLNAYVLSREGKKWLHSMTQHVTLLKRQIKELTDERDEALLAAGWHFSDDDEEGLVDDRLQPATNAVLKALIDYNSRPAGTEQLANIAGDALGKIMPTSAIKVHVSIARKAGWTIETVPGGYRMIGAPV